MKPLLLLLLPVLAACSSAVRSPSPAASGFLPGQGRDIATLDLARPSETIEVADGAAVTLTPTLVRKTIGKTTVTMYGYNGQIPGPLLRVRQGSTFTVDVTNAIDLPTSIHWHGVRVANANDGTVDVTQPAIEPGGTFRYAVTVPDEGMFWYHPHVREDIEQDLGLYGNLLVVPNEEDAYAPVTTTVPLFLDDIALTADGALIPYGAADADHALMGRFGTTMLVNGEPRYALQVQRGAVVRFYLTNAANTRTFRWTIDGARMKLVGGDMGRLARERFVDDVTLAPAERAVVDVLFPTAGTFTMRHEGSTARTLGTVTVTSAAAPDGPATAFATARTNADVAAEIETLRPLFDQPVDRVLRLTADVTGMQQMGHNMHGGMMPADRDGIEWEDTMPAMNTGSTRANTLWKIVDAATAKANDDIRYTFARGDVVKLRIVNDAAGGHPMQHPIHLHGQRFLVLSVNGTTNPDLGWKDTVLVPRGGTVDILVEMSNPGAWMLHCHIGEHLTNGMMARFDVTP